jgi:cytochrome c-type biogenesis protein CcmH/NrfG
MSTELDPIGIHAARGTCTVPPVPWRDPETVPPAKLREDIRDLEKSCEQSPRSADLRTCLGMAYAMNQEVYKSMDALELAVQLEPDHFSDSSNTPICITACER